MALNQDHITIPKTPFSRTCILTAAETSFHNPTAGNLQDLLLAADNTDGFRLTRLYGIPRAAIGTNNHLQVYKRVGAVYTLIDSALMLVVSPAAAVAAPKTDFGYSVSFPMEFEAGVGLACGMGLAVPNGVVIRAEGGFYAG